MILLADDNATANQLSGWSHSHQRTSPDDTVQFPHDTPWWPAVFALKWDNTASNYYVSARWETFKGCCSPSADGGGRARHIANCLLTHSYLLYSGHWYLTLTFRAVSVCCDSAKSTTPTQGYTVVALAKSDNTYSVMLVWSKTVQALDFSLDVKALARKLPVSQPGLHLWSVLPEWGFSLVEGYTSAKGTPLSMWQVRVWWTGWMEIASGPESVLMNSCQSTDRPVCNVSQAQVQPRHP